MRKKVVILLMVSLITILLSACHTSRNTSDNGSKVDDSASGTETSDSEEIDQFSTESDKEATQVGYTPIGVKVLKLDNEENDIDYIYINSKEGWKASYEYIGMFKENVTLYKTEDSGISWSELTSTVKDNYTIPLSAKSGMIFTDSKNGWITTEIPQPGYIGLYKTADGGATWEERTIVIPDVYSDIEFKTYPPVFFTLNDAILLSGTLEEDMEQLVYVTHDGGVSWTQVKENDDAMFQWNYAKNSSDGNASGWKITYNGKTWRTVDAITWEQE
ncbi:MAG TPA: hypothetical protein VHQ24_07900 [Lachnospiraceae bacterium]|nr:hypothetical protein [Lachnospiraceae bacterium]